jgi:hypothetical protein
LFTTTLLRNPRGNGILPNANGNSYGKLNSEINGLQSQRIDLESLTEKLDTGSPTGKLVFHVFAALAEFVGFRPLTRLATGFALDIRSGYVFWVWLAAGNKCRRGAALADRPQGYARLGLLFCCARVDSAATSVGGTSAFALFCRRC